MISFTQQEFKSSVKYNLQLPFQWATQSAALGRFISVLLRFELARSLVRVSHYAWKRALVLTVGASTKHIVWTCQLSFSQ